MKVAEFQRPFFISEPQSHASVIPFRRWNDPSETHTVHSETHKVHSENYTYVICKFILFLAPTK